MSDLSNAPSTQPDESGLSAGGQPRPASEPVPTDEVADTSPAHRSGWPPRVRLIWLLLALALVPALVVSRLPGGWRELPPVGRWAVIGMGAAGTVAVVYLIITGDSESDA